MAGIYIHIPFCRKACHYCNFHFSTNLGMKDEMVACMKQEMELRKDYLREPVETVYLGGGTPSLLGYEHVRELIEAARRFFPGRYRRRNYPGVQPGRCFPRAIERLESRGGQPSEHRHAVVF